MPGGRGQAEGRRVGGRCGSRALGLALQQERAGGDSGEWVLVPSRPLRGLRGLLRRVGSGSEGSEPSSVGIRGRAVDMSGASWVLGEQVWDELGAIGTWAGQWGVPEGRAALLVLPCPPWLLRLHLSPRASRALPGAPCSRPALPPSRGAGLDTLGTLVRLFPELPCPWRGSRLAQSFPALPQLREHILPRRGHPRGALQSPCVPRYVRLCLQGGLGAQVGQELRRPLGQVLNTRGGGVPKLVLPPPAIPPRPPAAQHGADRVGAARRTVWGSPGGAGVGEASVKTLRATQLQPRPRSIPCHVFSRSVMGELGSS